MWLQLVNTRCIERMQYHLNDYGPTANPLSGIALNGGIIKPQVGQLYCVKWSEDGRFYRAINALSGLYCIFQ